MGFLSGVVTGLALAAGAAVWYMSRSGERFRDQYQVDKSSASSVTSSRCEHGRSSRR